MKKEIGICCLAMLIVCLILATQSKSPYGPIPHQTFKHDCPFCKGTQMWVTDKPTNGEHLYIHFCMMCGKNYLTDENNRAIYTTYR